MSMKIGKAIKLFRINLGLSQKELAQRAAVSINYLSLIENDRRVPSNKLLERLAVELNTSTSQILLQASEKPKNLPKDQEELFGLLKDLLLELGKVTTQSGEA
ncbi:helix-turn-helix domain-containing protein [Candidatus Poribacteria bacterium]